MRPDSVEAGDKSDVCEGLGYLLELVSEAGAVSGPLEEAVVIAFDDRTQIFV